MIAFFGIVIVAIVLAVLIVAPVTAFVVLPVLALGYIGYAVVVTRGGTR